tara:strand:- start:3238 stop:4083 length:846 start_codon:yes stop_codon:yes gene_type:complete
MSDWSSFTEDKELADAWRHFLNEKNKRQRKKEEKKAREAAEAAAAAAETAAPVETPSEEAPEASPEEAPEGDAPEGDAPEGDAPEGGGGRGAAAKKALGKFGKMFYKKPGEFLPSMKSDWKGVGKFNLGATSGQKARRQLALMGDIDLSGVKGRQAAAATDTSAAAAAAADSAGSETAAKPASEAYQKLTGYFLNRFAGGENVEDGRGMYNAAKDLYKSMTPDEQKKIAAYVSSKIEPNFPNHADKARGILGIPKPVGEHIDLSLEDLIKEELLRVLNEEE